MIGNTVNVLLQLLKNKPNNINSPDMDVIGKICKHPRYMDYACLNANNAISAYRDIKSLPNKTTCILVETTLEIKVNGPCFTELPHLMSAVDKNGRQLIVKTFRRDANSANIGMTVNQKIAAINNELEFHRNLMAVNNNIGFVETVGVSKVLLPSNEVLDCIIMPHYISTVLHSPSFFAETIVTQSRRICGALKYMHDNGMVHMDVKGDNIFVNSDGLWFLGDFGSCVKIGQPITSTTPSCYYKKLIGLPAEPKYDYYMLLVAILIELLEIKGDYNTLFYTGGVQHINNEKIHEQVRYHISNDGIVAEFMKELIELADMKPQNDESANLVK